MAVSTAVRRCESNKGFKHMGKKINTILAAGFIAGTAVMGVGTVYTLWGTPLSELSSAVGDEVFGKNTFISYYGLTQRLLGKRQILDSSETENVTRLNNGWLTFTYPEFDGTQYAENTAEFQQWLAERGIPFLYVETPFKVSKYDPQLPLGVEDYNNSNADLFLSVLAEKQVPYMDLREVMREQGLDHYEMFNRTDHHWTSEASFWCVQQLYPAICDTLGETVNQALLAEESYQWTTYEDIFLGSEGRRAGIPYGGMDDFTVITPLFETSIRGSRPYESIKSRREAEGTFEETLLHTEILEREDVYNRACDDVYGSNYALQVTENLDETVSDKTILVLKDSFGRPVVDFLANAFREVHAVDLRKLTDVGIREYVQEIEPDMVIVLYNPGQLRESQGVIYTFE